MVLKANTATATEIVRPGFEPMDDEVQMSTTPAANSAPANPVPAEPIAAAPFAPAANDPTPAPVLAPAPAAALAVYKAPSKFAKMVTDMKGIASFAYGNFSVYKVINGKIRCAEDKNVLGAWVKVRMMSWDEHTQIAPGSDAPKAKNAVGYSVDGVIIDSIIGEEYAEWVGKKVADYLDFLRSGDYRLAKASVYLDIECAILDSDLKTEATGDIVQVTMAPSSIRSFNRYQTKLESTGRAVDLCIPGYSIPDDPFTFFLVCEDAAKGDISWTKLGVSLKAPVKG